MQQELINKQEERRSRGLDIFNDGLVEQKSKSEYIVKGQYEVIDLSKTELEKDSYICDCRDYQFNPIYLCKHIHAVIYYQLFGA